MESIVELKNAYHDLCNEYLETFCKNMGVTSEEEPWVADDAGSVACVGDYFFSFCDVIKYCVDNSLTDFDDIIAWNDYCLSCESLGIPSPNYKSWHRGCPVIPTEKLDSLIAMKAELEEEVDNLKHFGE